MSIRPSYEELEQRIRELEDEATGRMQTQEACVQQRDFSEALIHSSPVFLSANSPNCTTLMMSAAMLQSQGQTSDKVFDTEYLTTFIPESERRLNFLPDATMAVDCEGKVIVWNRAMEKLSGVKAEDMLGKKDHAHATPFYGSPRPVLMDFFIHPDVKVPGNYHSFKRDIDVLTAEVQYSVGGRTRWLQIRAGGLYDRDGKVIGAIESIRDITDSKQFEQRLKNREAEQRLKNREAEQRLKKSEEGYRAIFENTGTATVVIEADTTLSLVNSQFEQLSGCAKDRVERKMSWRDFVMPEDLQKMEEQHELRRRDPRKALRNFEFRFHDIRGNVVDILLTIGMVPGTDKSIASLLDITGRKKAEEALRCSEERYRLLAENVQDIIWVTDLDLRLTYVSPSAERVLGYGREEILSLTPTELLTNPSYAEAIDKLLQELSLQKKWPVSALERSLNLELEMVCKDGSRIWTEVTTAFLYGDDGRPKGILGVTRDISGRKRAEEERKLYEMRLIQAQKMEAIGTLAGGIAHDFNNILSPIIGFTELTLEDVPEGSVAHDQLKEVLVAANRAKELVQQIHTFSRQTVTKRTPVQVQLIVKEGLKLLRASMPSTIEIRHSIDPRPGTVLAEPVHIHQLFMNLCTNACQAIHDEGGVLSVSLCHAYVDSVFTQLHPGIKEGPCINLSVQDTGCGMDNDTLQKIFDPFFTTKEKDKGTGLGLSIVHGIVSSLGGVVIVTSESGKGSTFDVYLPEYQGDGHGECPSEQGVPRGKGEHVLMVDDEAAILHMGAGMLKRLGYRTTVASSGTRAMKLLQPDPWKFDCVITDRTMPDMSGVQLATEMLELRPDLPVILTSGYRGDDSPDDTLPGCVHAFLEKPYTLRSLAVAVHDTIRAA